MPVTDERGIFERISLGAFQAGLSWVTILRKRPALRRAFGEFDPDTVAAYTDSDVARLLGDLTIIRNRRKILAAITNASATTRLRDHGGLAALVWSFKPDRTPQPRTTSDIPVRSAESAALSRALGGDGYVFVGPVTMFALMESTGIIDTHLIGSYRRGSSGVWPAS
jgi:DNA-3-methyladenine glycosylase I